MNYLISGASGFVGFNLVHKLLQQTDKNNLQLLVPKVCMHKKEEQRLSILHKENFSIIEHDILIDTLDINKIKEFDVLFHLAAFTETETKSNKVRANDLGTYNLISQLQPLLKNKHIVYTSSLASVDRNKADNTPLDESAPCTPRTIYGKTKLDAEDIIKEKSDKIGFTWSAIRFSTLYGPGYRPGGMFELFKEGLEKGKLSTRMAWPGKLSMVYIDDALEILIELSNNEKAQGQTYHQSSGYDPPYDELITLIAETLELKRRRIVLPSWCWKTINFFVWNRLLFKILPFKIKTLVWRVSLTTTDGLVANGNKLNELRVLDYLDLKEGLKRTYLTQ